jgi:hypothetical protein
MRLQGKKHHRDRSRPPGSSSIKQTEHGGRTKIKISTNYLNRYKEPGLLLWKNGRSNLVQQMGIDGAVDPQAAKVASASEAKPEQL